MAQESKIIKHHLVDLSLELRGQGKSTTKIAELLTLELAKREPTILNIDTGELEHDTISQPTVYRFIKAVDKERAATTKAIVQDYLKESTPKDLEALDEVLNFNMAILKNEKVTVDPKNPENQTLVKGDYDVKLRQAAGREVVNTVATKLRFSGVLDSDISLKVSGDKDADPIETKSTLSAGPYVRSILERLEQGIGDAATGGAARVGAE
jgi:hypothetical protein